MKSVNINPHIRYAAKTNIYAVDSITVSYDCRLLYMICGHCTLNISDKRYDLSTGSLAMWRSGTEYQFSDADSAEAYIVNFDFTQNNTDILSPIPVSRGKYIAENTIKAPVFSDCTALNSTIVQFGADRLKSHIAELCSEFNQKKIYFSQICGVKLKEILFEILRGMVFGSKSTNEMLDTILDYIKEHFRENITNESLGELIGYHPYYINKLMLDYVHTTLHQYLLNYRMELALGQLLDPNKPICEIAQDCGFHSIYYFSRYFKKKMGVGPAEYRKSRRSMI